MAEFKGTQSQWTRRGNQVMSTENKTIADCSNDLMLMSETNKNAQLIATAPEMLEALNEMVRMYEIVQPAGGWQGVYDEAVSVIKKATE